jgi:hypothetical protein
MCHNENSARKGRARAADEMLRIARNHQVKEPDDFSFKKIRGCCSTPCKCTVYLPHKRKVQTIIFYPASHLGLSVYSGFFSLSYILIIAYFMPFVKLFRL